MGTSRFIKTFAGVMLMLLSVSSPAQQEEVPQGRVILTVSGAISTSNVIDSHVTGSGAVNQAEDEKSFRFDLAMLEALGLASLTTETPWTEGSIEFAGVLARDVLARVKADGTSVQAVALDDYVVEIPIQDFHDNDVIIATRVNGKPMRVRENGPLWVIYPWTEESDLRRPRYYARSIWQLKSFVVLP